MTSFKSRDRVSLNESSINPKVTRLVNEVESLLTAHQLQQKLTRLPSDLPSVMKVKEEINNFLMNGELNSLISKENNLLLESERFDAAYADYQSWNGLLLDARNWFTANANNKGMLPLSLVTKYLSTMEKIEPTRKRDVPKSSKRQSLV